MKKTQIRPKTHVPYARAKSGDRARADIIALLKKFGCESVGIMDDFAENSVVVAFKHRGRPVQLRASAKGWAQLYLQANPRPPGRQTERDYRAAVLAQGHIAVNSILRDWIKGQLTAVECGLMSFEAVFLPYMLTSDGRPLIERVEEAKLLPPPSSES